MTLRRLSLCFALAGTACVTVGSAQKAETLGAGVLQLGVEPGAGLAVPRAQTAPQPFPDVNVAARYGVSERVDLGLRVGTTVLEASAKLLLTSPAHKRLAVSVVPSVSGAFLPSQGLDAQMRWGLALSLPCLVGIELSPRTQLVLGPRAIGSLEVVSNAVDGRPASARTLALSLGTSLGVAFELTEGLALLPEVGFVVPVAAGSTPPANGAEASSFFVGNGLAATAHLNLLITFGRRPAP